MLLGCVSRSHTHGCVSRSYRWYRGECIKHMWVGCVSLLPAAFKYMAVSAGCTNMAVSAGRIDGKCNIPAHATVGCVIRQRIIQKHGCVSRPHKHWQSSTPNCTNHPCHVTLGHPGPSQTHGCVSRWCRWYLFLIILSPDGSKTNIYTAYSTSKALSPHSLSVANSAASSCARCEAVSAGAAGSVGSAGTA